MLLNKNYSTVIGSLQSWKLSLSHITAVYVATETVY